VRRTRAGLIAQRNALSGIPRIKSIHFRACARGLNRLLHEERRLRIVVVPFTLLETAAPVQLRRGQHVRSRIQAKFRVSAAASVLLECRQQFFRDSPPATLRPHVQSFDFPDARPDCFMASLRSAFTAARSRFWQQRAKRDASGKLGIRIGQPDSCSLSKIVFAKLHKVVFDHHASRFVIFPHDRERQIGLGLLRATHANSFICRCTHEPIFARGCCGEKPQFGHSVCSRAVRAVLWQNGGLEG